MGKKSKTVSDAEKMLTKEIEAKAKRMKGEKIDTPKEEESEVPKMDHATIVTMQGIIEICSEEMDRQYEKMFVELGGPAMVKKKSGKAKGLLELDPDTMVAMGMDFRVKPEVIDSVTDRPLKGKAMVFEIVKEIEFDLTKNMMTLQEKLLKEAMEKDKENEYIKAALIAVQANLKESNENS